MTEDATPLYWSGLEAIAEALAQGYPDVNPLDLGIPALFRRVLSLPGFSDDPDAATEEMLEQIQMLWHEEVALYECSLDLGVGRWVRVVRSFAFACA